MRYVEVDVVGRMGGEEFAVLLPETAKEKALEVAERLRESLAKSELLVEAKSAPLHITVSIGVASLESRDLNIDELINLADKALYEAKNMGRNKVCFASDH